MLWMDEYVSDLKLQQLTKVLLFGNTNEHRRCKEIVVQFEEISFDQGN